MPCRTVPLSHAQVSQFKQQMRRSRTSRGLALALLMVAVFIAANIGNDVSAASVWGNLKPGPYRVGFRTIFTYDLSRAPLGDQSTGRKSALGRQMQINIWYPARATSHAPAMQFRDYVHLLVQELDFSPLTTERKKQSEIKFVEQPSDLGGDVKRLKESLPAILALEMAAIRNAPAIGGRFPLLVFPDFRAPATNSIMSEFLASHGFVVATTSLKGTHEAEFDVGVTGIETVATDIGFLIATVKTQSVVNPERIALMGVGITASGALAFITRNPEVDALVSLDGGIPTSFEDRLLKRTPYFDLAAVRVPILGIHAPHANVDPAIFNQYKYSTRHVIHFPKMSEFHFLNYGMLERFAPGIIGKPPGDTQAGFEWASLYVLNFLKAYLNGDQQSRHLLYQPPTGASGLVAVDTKPALESPPRLSELKSLVRQGGMESVVAVYQRLKEKDPQPFSQETFVSLYTWLSFQRDADWKGRRALSLLRVDSYPDSARAHFTMAQVFLQLRETDSARKHFKEALRLLGTDSDPLLDLQTRTRIEAAATRELKNLEG